MDTVVQPPSPPPSHQALEQAAHWFAVLDSGEATAAERQSWQAWLTASAEHRAAWLYVERISGRFSPIKNSPERRSALAAYGQAYNRPRRQILASLGVLAGGGLLGWAAWRHTALPGLALAWMADYRSGTGEVREVALPDGTVIWLNAVSAFDLDYQSRHRSVRLLQGDILVDTAPDAAQRPFYVHTPQGRLQALGTRFAVRLRADETHLAVFEGAVEVRTAHSGATAVIAAGQQIHFDGAALAMPEAADPASEAWTRGLLIARDMPLADVVAELRRHVSGHLGLSPEIAGLRVFGGYPVGDPERTLAMLESVLPIQVHRTLPWWVSIEPRRSPTR